MPSRAAEKCNILALPPEILIRIFADVAVYNPKTFFSLGLVCLDWKHFLMCYKKLIVHDIEMQYEADKNAPFVDYSKLKDVDDVDEMVPPRLRYNVPLFIDYVNTWTSIYFTDPTQLRRCRCLLEWAIDYDVLPWWLPLLAANPPSPMLATTLKTLQKDYSIEEIKEYFLPIVIFACIPGDPENIIVYEACKSAGITFSALETNVSPMLLQHLAVLHRNHSVDMYNKHLAIIVSNGFNLSVGDMREFGCHFCPDILEYLTYSNRSKNERVVTVRADWNIVFYKDSVSKRKLTCKMDADSVYLWKSMHDQLMLNTTSSFEERTDVSGEFFLTIYEIATWWGLGYEVFDYCFANRIFSEEELEEGMFEALPDIRFIAYLIDRQGYDYSKISKLILSVDGKDDYHCKLERLGSHIFGDLPQFKDVFYREVIADGALDIGYHAFGNYYRLYLKIPLYFLLIAVERMNDDVLNEIMGSEDVSFVENILRECIFHNMCTTRISWYLERLQETCLFRQQFLDDMIEYAQSLRLPDIVKILLAFKGSRRLLY